MGLRAIDYMYVSKEIAQRVQIESLRERFERRFGEEKCKENSEESIELMERALDIFNVIMKKLR